MDVLFITETFLKPTCCDSLYEIPGYTLLWKDRQSKVGGGVAVYCKNSLTFKRREDLECDSVEILWLEIFPYKSKRSLLMAGCYRPLSYIRAEDNKFDECIETAYLTNKEIILTGDFNINLLATDARKHHLSKSLKNMHFNQMVTDCTRPVSGTCLDHIYANKSQHIVNVSIYNYALLDHWPIFAVRRYFKQSKQTHMHNTISYRDIKKIDEGAFKSTLVYSPWDTAFVFEDVNGRLGKYFFPSS